MADDATVEPAGFGNCSACPLMQTGSVETCTRCAGRSFTGLPADRCLICDGSLDPAGACRNRMCNWSVAERWFALVWAVSSNTGPLRDAIHRYKYKDKWGWQLIFGRVLAGFLEENAETFGAYDLVVPSPTYVGEGGRSRDHIREMVRVIEQEAGRSWPIAYDVIRKTAPTPKMVDAVSWHQRFEIARTQLRAALDVPDPEMVRGKRVLVVDDVFTAGHTLMEVARALRLAGATEVSEVVLARQTWTT